MVKKTFYSILTAVLIVAFSAVSGNAVAADTTKPKISSASFSPTSASVGDKIKIKAKVTDSGGLAKVYAKIIDSDGNTLVSINLYDDGKHGDGSAKNGTFARTWVSSKAQAETYKISVRAKDKAGNLRTKTAGTITFAESSDDDSGTDVGPQILDGGATIKDGGGGTKYVSFWVKTQNSAICRSYYEDNTYEKLINFCNTGGTTHSCNADWEGEPYIYVKCKDNTGTNSKSVRIDIVNNKLLR